MASSNANFLAVKVDFLNQQKQQLQDAVDCYVQQVVDIAEGLIQCDADNGQKFLNVSKKLEDAVVFLMTKTSEIKGGPVTEHQRVNLIPDSSVKETAQSSCLEEARLQVSDQDLIKLQNRMDSLEKQMTLTNSSVEKLSKKKSSLSQLQTDMRELRDKVDEIEEIKKTLGDIDDRVEGIEKDESYLQMQDQVLTLTDSMKKMTKQSEEAADQRGKDIQRLRRFEERISKVEDTVSDSNSKGSKLKGRVNEIEQQLTKQEGVFKKVSKMEVEVETLRETSDENLDKISELENKLESVDEDWMSKGNKKMENIEEKLAGVMDQRQNDEEELEQVKSSFNTLLSRMDSLENRPESKATIGFTAVKEIKVASGFVRHSDDFRGVRPRESSHLGPVTVDKYTSTLCDNGNHFDISTGIFTAPTSGLYFVALSTITSTEIDSGETLYDGLEEIEVIAEEMRYGDSEFQYKRASPLRKERTQNTYEKGKCQDIKERIFICNYSVAHERRKTTQNTYDDFGDFQPAWMPHFGTRPALGYQSPKPQKMNKQTKYERPSRRNVQEISYEHKDYLCDVQVMKPGCKKRVDIVYMEEGDMLRVTEKNRREVWEQGERRIVREKDQREVWASTHLHFSCVLIC